MKEWMGTLLMPTKHVCILRAWKLWLNITTPTEINGWRPTQLSSIFIASYLFSSKGNTYWRYQPFPTLLSFNCWGLYIKHVSFWNGVKSSLERDFWYFFAGIKPLWLFAWSSYWLWIPSTRLQCLETKPNTDATMGDVSPENMEEDLTMNFDP